MALNKKKRFCSHEIDSNFSIQGKCMHIIQQLQPVLSNISSVNVIEQTLLNENNLKSGSNFFQ